MQNKKKIIINKKSRYRMNISWYEILIAVIIGLLLGGLVSYILFYPLYEAFRDFEDVYTKECNAIIEYCNKIKETLEKIK